MFRAVGPEFPKVGGYFVVSILAFANVVGMHNNTKDGNSFRLLNPLVLFDESQFNEDGNRCRVALLKILVVAAVLGLIAMWAL